MKTSDCPCRCLDPEAKAKAFGESCEVVSLGCHWRCRQVDGGCGILAIPVPLDHKRSPKDGVIRYIE